jgi:hypothetical protein
MLMPGNVFSLDPKMPLLPHIGAMQVILLLARYKFSEVQTLRLWMALHWKSISFLARNSPTF